MALDHYITLGRSGLRVSPFCLGAMTFGAGTGIRRPDIVAPFWQVDAAMHDVKEAKAEFYPDVNLSAAAGLDAFGWGRFLTSSSRQIQAGPAIHLPILDAGALRSQLKGRYANFDHDVATYNQTLINALSDVATKISQIRSDA